MTMSKVCAVCGKDVSGEKRVKDSHGSYHCQPCWDARAARAPAGAAPRATESMAEVASARTPAGPEMALFAVSKDVGPFQKLGNMFNLPGAKYIGPAVASPVAIYLVKSARQTGGHGGGLVGAMISAALQKDDPLSTCNVSDLPASVRPEVDPKGKLGQKEVVVLPRASVSFVKAGSFNNVIKFTIGSETFAVMTGFFSVGKMKQKLQEFGWQLNTQVTPTAAAVHHMRNPDEPSPTAMPAWQRALMIVGAVVLLIVVVAIRVAMKR